MVAVRRQRGEPEAELGELENQVHVQTRPRDNVHAMRYLCVHRGPDTADGGCRAASKLLYTIQDLVAQSLRDLRKTEAWRSQPLGGDIGVFGHVQRRGQPQRQQRRPRRSQRGNVLVNGWSREASGPLQCDLRICDFGC